MNVESLSDNQLYTLVQSKELSSEIRQIVLEEFGRRNFSIEQLDKLSMEHEAILSQSEASLTPLEKCLIMLVPFFPVIHAILANRHISKGSRKKWKQHWRFVTIGYIFWTVIVLLFAKFYFFRSS